MVTEAQRRIHVEQSDPLTPLSSAIHELVEKWKKERAAYLDGAIQSGDETTCAMNWASARTCDRFLADLESVLAALPVQHEPCVEQAV